MPTTTRTPVLTARTRSLGAAGPTTWARYPQCATCDQTGPVAADGDPEADAHNAAAKTWPAQHHRLTGHRHFDLWTVERAGL